MHSLEPSDLVDRVFGERFRVLGRVGLGPRSEVCVAEDLHEDRQVALKVFDQAVGEDPEQADRLVAAIERSAAISHVNVVPLYAYGRDGVRIWIASALCRGGSLRSLLDLGNTLTPSQALVMTLEAARGLAHAHEHGAVHGAIKPENVLFTEDQRLQLSDVGLAQALTDAPLGRSDRALDVVRYVAPEQAAGVVAGGSADVYSLALTVDEAVSGIGPPTADTAAATRAQRVSAAADLQAELGSLRPPLERCGRQDPDDRPEAGELTIAVLAAAETMARPGPLPLAGVAGLEEVEGFDVPDTPSLDDLPELPDLGLDVEPGALVAVPDLVEPPERVAIEDLETAEPTFAEVPADEPELDVPVAAAPGRSETVFRVDREDLDDRLPVWPLIVLALLVGGAIALWVMLSSVGGAASASVPNLVGADAESAEAATADSGWTLERLETRSNDTVAGAVVAQSPEAGVDLAEGETVTITVSLGPEMVEIPNDLPGLTLAQAQDRLAIAGLVVGAVTEEASESVDSGLVIGLDEPTRQKPQGEAVSLRVSVGPEARVVPDVIGLNIAEATVRMVELRLQAVEEPTFHPDAEPGTVLGSDPGPATRVPADSQVILRVSAGPEPVMVPDVSDLSLADAVDIIESFGLIFADTVGTPGQPVIATSPEAGQIVPFGSEITIVLDDPPEDEEGDGEGEDADEGSG
ncbi:MAG: PASTA domain-containing protein [Actinomycetota bacterium]